mmetsp:Transcript_9739/g.35678  ORF Transcript_9739/g.35678 Transcript_9739/m.35678 type:complete len:284 (-) Transcript_9739:461-1312(-)
MEAANVQKKKIFVGGLASTCDEAQLKTFFSKFGPVLETVVMRDAATQRPRGFGFVIFEQESALDKVLVSRYHEMGDKKVEVKRAVPRGEIQPVKGHDRSGRGHAGRGGSRGSSGPRGGQQHMDKHASNGSYAAQAYSNAFTPSMFTGSMQGDYLAAQSMGSIPQGVETLAAWGQMGNALAQVAVDLGYQQGYVASPHTHKLGYAEVAAQGSAASQRNPVMIASATHGWSEHAAPDGTPYYYNQRTGQSVWERPPELGAPPPPLPAQTIGTAWQGQPSQVPQQQ